MDTISEKLQAILVAAAARHDTDILWHTEHETLYEAINFYVCAQAAEIEALKAEIKSLEGIISDSENKSAPSLWSLLGREPC